MVGTTGWAQEAPVYVGSVRSIIDAQGHALPGTDPSAPAFGWDAVKGDLVQVLQANNGVFPPRADGTPHGSNALLYVTRIGRGVIPQDGTRGQFAASVVPRPSGTLVVRVFDGPSLAQATHYADSQAFVVNGNAMFMADITQVSQGFAADSDGDGLNDCWEDYLGSDSDEWDSDEDGVGDEAEYRAGTDLDDDDSYLGLSSLQPVAGGPWKVAWDSVVGMSYQVEYADNLRGGTFVPVSDVVTATGAVCQVHVTLTVPGPNGTFRVRLVD